MRTMATQTTAPSSENIRVPVIQGFKGLKASRRGWPGTFVALVSLRDCQASQAAGEPGGHRQRIKRLHVHAILGYIRHSDHAIIFPFQPCGHGTDRHATQRNQCQKITALHCDQTNGLEAWKQRVCESQSASFVKPARRTCPTCEMQRSARRSMWQKMYNTHCRLQQQHAQQAKSRKEQDRVLCWRHPAAVPTVIVLMINAYKKLRWPQCCRSYVCGMGDRRRQRWGNM